jgi:general secretion pathway protein I
MDGCPASRIDGFTLFETLVAMMIFATALVIILQLFSGGLRANHISDRYTRAVLHAREKMDELLLSEDVAQKVFSGDWDDGYTWQAEYVGIETISEGREGAARVPFQLNLSVSWTEHGKHRSVDLSTIRLGREVSDESREK